MKRFFGLLLVLAIWGTPRAAMADSGPNAYQWPGWEMSTNEGFNLDTGISNVHEN